VSPRRRPPCRPRGQGRRHPWPGRPGSGAPGWVGPAAFWRGLPPRPRSIFGVDAEGAQAAW